MGYYVDANGNQKKVMSVVRTKSVGQQEGAMIFDTIEGGNNSQSNIYYQSLMFIPTPNVEENANVDISFNIYIDGTFDSYSKIFWVDSVYTQAGGEVKTSTTILDATQIQQIGNNWYRVSFTAKAHVFQALRINTQYNVYDTSSFGMGVYIMATNKSAHAFKYYNKTTAPWEVLPKANISTSILYSHFFRITIGGTNAYLRLTSTRQEAYTTADQIRSDMANGKVVNVMRNYTTNKVSQAVMLVNADVSPTTFVIVSFSGVGSQYIDGLSGEITDIGTDTITKI